jgi:hypothetical protein
VKIFPKSARRKLSPPVRTSAHRAGFSLVSVLTLGALIVILALGMMSLSAVELRKSNQQNHAMIARSNARLALMLALGELQKHAGPDQRATTSAATLETSGASIPNRNWLGVWKTTFTQGSREWPVIGKRPGGATNESPYTLTGTYEDLRHTQSSLNGGKWRNGMRLSWLVSKRSDSIDPATALNPADPNVVELLGRGAFGDEMAEAEFSKNRVLVEKVDAGPFGSVAWHITDESQKASIAPVPDPRADALAFEAAAQANPALVKAGEASPFGDLNAKLKPHGGKFATFGSVDLALTEETQRAKLGQLGNHFTIDSGGLFANPVTGGLKRDLTPMLLAKKSDASVEFALSYGGKQYAFSSRLPVIPGQEHGVLGPGFDSLRDWAQHAHTNQQNAETDFPSSAVRIRPTANWAHAISDGAASDASNWAAQAPKIHPVMTDVRWHYYFSIHNGRIRTHIIPRVCLWNPYSRSLRIPNLSVLMPNPYFGVTHGMHFFPEESHANALIATGVYPFSKWVKRSGYVGGSVYKMRMNPFPTQRYLAFTLEGTTIGAGECHVFSPKITTPQVSAAGVNLQLYQQTNPSQNVLSSSAPQGTDHFYFDHASSITYQIQATTLTGSKVDWRNLTATQVNQIDLRRIFDYQPELVLQTAGKVEGFPFVLKVGTSSTLANLHSNTSHPSLQLVFFGGGGAHSNNYFGYIGETWGSANQQDNSFGYLEKFADAPMKDSPDTHQVGAKILWMDERGTEGNAPPLRVNRWPINHMALNVAPVANWNVRAQLSARSPSAQVANRWYMTSAGAWYLQFVPYSPQNVNDQPSLNSNNHFVKNPFGASVDYSFFPNVVLFDLPSSGHGVLSMARMRHAMLSPYSWSPSYIVGHSLRDLHAPSDRTAHPVAADPYNGTAFPTRWDFLLGAAMGVSSHGARATAADSRGLLQIGNQQVTKSVSGGSFSSSDEILAYDIAYEVNQNLWDGYFISSIPLSGDTESFSWDLDKPLTNPRYRFNPNGSLAGADVPVILSGADGLGNGFYRGAEFLHNTAAFNVNSTSVEAWTAFLSSTLGKKLPLRSGELGGDKVSFARHSLPSAAADTEEAEPNSWGAWAGARLLSNDEVRTLAEYIVVEVKKRGPFLSLADFVNRRLADRNDETSHMGALDAAIMRAGLNENFSADPIHRTTSLNAAGTDAQARDNNHPDFSNGYRYQDSSGQFTTTQPQSKAWGMPGFLTQGDLLEPLAPALTTRGDTFVIRAYGESRDASGIKARAWIEATVVRTPLYLEHRDSGQTGTAGNTPLDSALDLNHSNGLITEGNLSETNRRFGRQFKVKSFRWLHPDEV